MRKLYLAVLAFVLMLTACGQVQTGAADPVMVPTQELPTMMTPPTTLPAPLAPTSVAPQPDAAVVAHVQSLLASSVGVDEAQLVFREASAKDWPNGALGCPQEGQSYLDMIVAGFVLTFTGNGKSYTIHTDTQGAMMILCEDGKPTNLLTRAPTGTPPTPSASKPDPATAKPAPAAVVTPLAVVPPVPPSPTKGVVESDEVGIQTSEKARLSLARELGIDVSGVKVVEIEPVEWDSSGLGCPKSDTAYLQVITPGYRIVLSAQDRSFEYHADQRGTVVRCDLT